MCCKRCARSRICTNAMTNASKRSAIDFRGQTIRIDFLPVEDNGSVISFVIDDVTLIVQ